MLVRARVLTVGVAGALALLGACGGGPTMSAGRRAAIAQGDHARQFAYDDAILARFPAQGAANAKLADEVDDRRGALRRQREADFKEFVIAEITARGPVTPATAAAAFGRLLALRHEARRAEPAAGATPTARQEDLRAADTWVITPGLLAAATPYWTQVDALVTAGELAQAIVLGASIVDELPADAPQVAALAALQQRAAAAHLALVAADDDALVGARVLHTRLAHLHGAPGTDPGQSPADSALATEVGRSWTVEVDGDCADVRPRLEESYSRGTGQPATLTVRVDSCAITTEDLPATTRDLPYTVKVKKRIPKETWASSCRKASSLPDMVTTGGGTATKTEFRRTEGTTCDTPTKGFHGETEEVEVDEQRFETVTVAHRRKRARVRGTIVVTAGDQLLRTAFTLDAGGTPGDAYTSEHGGSPTFSDASLDSSARASFHGALAAEIAPLRDQLEATRRAAWTARLAASVAAGEPRAIEHAHMVMSRLTGTVSDEFATWLERTQHVPPAVLRAALGSPPGALPRFDLARDHAYAAPVLADVETDIHHALDDGTQVGLQSQLMMTLAVGIASAARATYDPHLGAVGQFSVGVSLPKSRYTTVGFGMRMGGGKGGGDSSIVDVDFYAGAGLHLGALSVVPLVGVGLDATPNYDAATAAPDGFGVPPGAYAEVGAVARLPLGPLTLEAMYTTALRTASAISRAKRADLRLTWFPAAVVIRYAEYLADGDGLLTPFSDAYAGKTLWILGGVGF